MDPKVAIIIPSYNSEQFLDQSVDSAVKQTYENFNIYIYDNQSTDKAYATPTTPDLHVCKFVSVNNTIYSFF